MEMNEAELKKDLEAGFEKLKVIPIQQMTIPTLESQLLVEETRLNRALESLRKQIELIRNNPAIEEFNRLSYQK